MKTFLHTQRKNFSDSISLHDCYCTEIKVEGRNVCFNFEDGFVVPDNNPNNQAGKHLKTDFSRVVLTHKNTALPRLAVLFVLSAASSPCPDFC
ncbi:hypothetical protein BC474_04235 [Neisseria meningitidis]|nr:hypothetical protein BC474_04235 [Neisseria meningitidis]